MRTGILLITLLMCSAVTAQTIIPGGNQSGTWDSSHDPYWIMGNVTVPAGLKLTIGPGVQVRFRGDFSFTVLGGLSAYGTVDDSVLFVWDYGVSPGAWKQIEFHNDLSDSAYLRYCHIESGERGVYANNCGVTMLNCLVRNTELSPIKGDGGQIHLTNCVIYNGGGSGLSLINTSAALTNTSISLCSGTSGHGINATGNGDLTVHGGYIGQNTGSGIYGFDIGVTTLDSVEIADNVHHGVNLSFSGNLNASRACVHDNTLHGIFLTSTSLDARNLTVSANGEHGIFASNGSLIAGSSIVDRNGRYGFYSQGALAILQYNNVWGNEEGAYFGCAEGQGSIASDPVFVSFPFRDFHLVTGSPCIDAGNPLDPLDPDGTRTDMGAFFYNQSAVLPGPATPAPAAFRIVSAWPNPFNPVLRLQVETARPGPAVLEAWTPAGRLAARVWEGRLETGLNTLAWDASGQASGPYLLRLHAGDYVQVIPCALVK
ncbi:MAG: right-handed parallel beta-helix repeat-containing protein [Candidatus Zixiibacteriota bacterium]|nr:MAG: right-handed parallel beta-helix repeat-containing protein [candidate division Zixibacteria bacterium]